MYSVPYSAYPLHIVNRELLILSIANNKIEFSQICSLSPENDYCFFVQHDVHTTKIQKKRKKIIPLDPTNNLFFLRFFVFS